MYKSCHYKALVASPFFAFLPIVTAARGLISNRCQSHRWSSPPRPPLWCLCTPDMPLSPCCAACRQMITAVACRCRLLLQSAKTHAMPWTSFIWLMRASLWSLWGNHAIDARSMMTSSVILSATYSVTWSSPHSSRTPWLSALQESKGIHCHSLNHWNRP